jgi:hypothetical protein
VLIIQNENSDILRYLLSLQRNRVKAMQSELSIKASAQDIRDPAKDLHLLRGFAFIAFPKAQAIIQEDILVVWKKPTIRAA